MSSALDRWKSPAWNFQAKQDAIYDLLNMSGQTAAIQANISGTGYSLNLISVTSTTASGNTRGWRVNVTTSDSIAHGDLQCIHGYLTLGTGVTLGAGAAVYPLSAWIDVPADITTGSGNVIAGVRAIFDANGVDLSALAGGGESALFYGQIWAAASSKLEHGLRIIAGAGSGFKNGISLGGSGSFTYDKLFDLTDFPDGTMQTLFEYGIQDATSLAHMKVFIGEAATSAAVFAAVGACGIGSLYQSSAGILFIKSAHTGASTDWISAATGAAV